MDVESAYELLSRGPTHHEDSGRFYGSSGAMPIGAGLFCDGVRFPLFGEEDSLFLTAEGLVYILTHECDIDAGNSRFFSNSVLICPVIKLEDFVVEYSESYSDELLAQFLNALSRRNVYRVLYIPPMGNHLYYGGLLNFNEIGHTSVAEFHENHRVSKVLSASIYGIRVIDKLLENHLLRPKSARLPLQDRD